MFIDDIFKTFGVVIGAAILTFLCILAILWLLLPMYVYQIRNRLDTLIKEVKLTRKEDGQPRKQPENKQIVIDTDNTYG